MRRSLGVVSLVFLCFGCGGGVSNGPRTDAGSGGSDGGGACIPNQQVSCACGGNVVGYQVCKPDGSGFLPCVCSDSGLGGAGGTGTGGAGGVAGSGTGGSSACTGPHPENIDIPGNGIDDDCDGKIDNAPVGCDSAILDIADNDPMDAAKAIGLCQVSDGTSWGLVSAKYVMADGTPLTSTIGHGLLDDFGPTVNVQEGKRMLVISSGTARRPTDPGYESPSGADHGESSAMPPGFPANPTLCPPGTVQAGEANDPVALELQIKAPANAKSIRFDADVYTYEFPQFVCSAYNDLFVVLQAPAPANAIKGNVVFDNNGDVVGSNSPSLLQVCVPQTANSLSYSCPLGQSQLSGTGFDETNQGGPHAATGWLETVSPIDPGKEFTIRFAVWDVGDHIFDSTVLVDDFRFSVESPSGASTAPLASPK